MAGVIIAARVDRWSMRHTRFQQAARAAFSTDDWLLLGSDTLLVEKFAGLTGVQDVEAFVFDAYDRLRHLREAQRGSGLTQSAPAVVRA